VKRDASQAGKSAAAKIGEELDPVGLQAHEPQRIFVAARGENGSAAAGKIEDEGSGGVTGDRNEPRHMKDADLALADLSEAAGVGDRDRLISGEQQRAAARREHRHQRRNEWQQSRAGHEQAAD
jgi:hypothetical protein